MNKLLSLVLAACLISTPVWAADGQPEPIKIGGVFTYSGMPDWASGGQNATQMAVDEWNAKGGLQGRKAELLLRDDRGDPAAGVQVGEDLIQREHVAALTGVSWTNVSLAVADLADKDQIPYVPVWCWNDKCTDRPHKEIFALDSHPSQLIAPLADWAARQPITRWAAIFPAEEFSRTAFKYFEAELKKKNPKAEIVDVRIYQYGTNPFAQIANIQRQKKVQGVFSSIAAQETLKYVRTMRKLGMDKNVVTVQSYLPPEASRPLKGEGPIGWYAQVGYPVAALDTPANKAFIDAYQKRFGAEPGELAFRSYIATKFVLEAISKAGSDKPAAITQALRGLTIQTPAGAVTMDATSQRSNLGYWYALTGVEENKPVLHDVVHGGMAE